MLERPKFVFEEDDNEENEQKRQERLSYLKELSFEFQTPVQSESQSSKNTAAINPENNNVKDTMNYELKIQNHQIEAKSMRPNPFFRQQNQSPIPPSNQQHFSIPPQLHSIPFDPYKYLSITKKNNKDYQIFLDSSMQTKRKRQKNKTIQTNNQSKTRSVNNSSHVNLNTSDIKQSQSNMELHQDHKDIILMQDFVIEPVDQNASKSYQFVIQRKCGINFWNPFFKIVSEDGKILVSAQKQSFHINSHYNIYTGQIGATKIGFIRGNFGGTEFDVYQIIQNKGVNIGSILHKTQLACSLTFRRMEVYIRNTNNEDIESNCNKNVRQLYQAGIKKIDKIVTKDPTWREDLQAFTMNFKGKSRIGSTKNTIMVNPNNTAKNSLLFCKQSGYQYYLEVSYPFSLLLAMGVLLTSFDFKLFCQ